MPTPPFVREEEGVVGRAVCRGLEAIARAQRPLENMMVSNRYKRP